MIGGKLRNITRDDAIQFARENGIRRPDAIIRDVVASLKQFRTIATKYGVSEQWTGRVETTIINHLKAWGEWQEEVNAPELTINGHIVSNIRIEQAYKGNFHLLATNSKYAFYTLSKRPLLTYLTFFYWCSGFIWALWVQKYKKSLIIRTIIR